MSDYDVVLLVEQPLSSLDASQIRSLHEAIEEPVRYHVLVPIEEAATRVEADLGMLSTLDPSGAVPTLTEPGDIAEIRSELLDSARAGVETSVARLTEAGAHAVGEVVVAEPISALAAKVAEVDAREAIVLTQPHVVREFLHLDWTSRARRHLGVPVLHLLEHETFDEQAGEGEGISGF